MGNNDARTRVGCAGRREGLPVAHRPSLACAWGLSGGRGCAPWWGAPSQPVAMVMLSLQRCLQLGNCSGGQANRCHPGVPTMSKAAAFVQQSQPGWAPAPGGGPLGEQGALSCRWACWAWGLRPGIRSLTLWPSAQQGTCFLQEGPRNPEPSLQLPFSTPFSMRAGQDRQSALARFESAWGAFDPRKKKKVFIIRDCLFQVLVSSRDKVNSLCS